MTLIKPKEKMLKIQTEGTQLVIMLQTTIMELTWSNSCSNLD